MTDITRVIDPGPALAASGLTSPRDFHMFLDSTFLRFWPHTPAADQRLRQAFTGLDWCHVMQPGELVREGVDFPDDRYGSLHVLVDPGC